MGFLLFCNSDADGTITSYVGGEYVIPTRQFDHFFFLPIEDGALILENIADYIVLDGVLQLREV